MLKDVVRKRYLDRMLKFKDRTEFVKVITGVRRCGKSTLMLQYMECLKDLGVTDDQIIYANFESNEFSEVMDRSSLFNLISSKKNEEYRVYLLFDEIQRIKEWELAINSAMVDLNVDIYITGSNAYMLSSDLSTYLAGRYVEIPMFPLSFGEFMELNGYIDDRDKRFNEYLSRGAFPIISKGFDDESARSILQGIYSDIVLKDIVQRDGIRDGKLLDRLVRHVLSNTGNLTSPGSLAKMLNHKNTGTIDAYLSLLCNAFIVYKAERYDLRDKHVLLSQCKYYCVDMGMRNAILGRSIADTGRLVESAVYLELLRRGYSVMVGKYGDMEIDFTAVKGDEVKHIQVTESLLGEDVRAREIRPFDMLKDHYEKIILSMDANEGIIDGIRCQNIVRWMLDDGYYN